MTKRCGRCRRFLGGHKRFCLKCIRIIKAAKRALDKTCSFCQTHNGGGKTLGEHATEGNYLCERCTKKIEANKEILAEFTGIDPNYGGKGYSTVTIQQTPDSRLKVTEVREAYQGKKAGCGYCGEVTHLYSTNRSKHKVCKTCKAWLEGLKDLKPIEEYVIK